MTPQETIESAIGMMLDGANEQTVIAELNKITKPMLNGATVKRPVTKRKSKTQALGEALPQHIATTKTKRDFKLPILENVLAKDGKLYSTDLDSWTISKTERADGVYSPIGKTLSLNQVRDACDFPVLPTMPPSYNYSLDFPHKQLAVCLKSAPKRDPRKVLLGILFQCKDGVLSIVSTDGKLFSWQKQTIQADKGDFSVVVPRTVCERLASFKKAQRLELTQSFIVGTEPSSYDHWAMRIDGQVEINFRPVDGIYPNYPQILPSAFQNFMILDGDIFLAGVKELLPFAEEKDYSIDLAFNEHEAVLTTRNRINGQTEARMLADSIGDKCPRMEICAYPGQQDDTRIIMPIKVSNCGEPYDDYADIEGAGVVRFNGKMLIDILTGMKNQSLGIAINSPSSPVALFVGI